MAGAEDGLTDTVTRIVTALTGPALAAGIFTASLAAATRRKRR